MEPSILQRAERHLSAGNIDEADTLYRRLEGGAARRAALNAGRTALLADRLTEAEPRLLDAAGRADTRQSALEALSDLYRRQGHTAWAADCFRQLGSMESAAAFDALGSGTVDKPPSAYGSAVAAMADSPLPLLHASVNGVEAWLLLDTGAEEPVLDPDLALAAGIITGGPTPAMAAGGAVAVHYGRCKSLSVSGATVHDLPVQIQPVSDPLSAYTPGRRVGGILGTSFLYRFTTAIDFEERRLELHPKGDAIPADPAATLPLKLAGAWMPVVSAAINGAGPFPLLIDSAENGYDVLLTVRAGREAGFRPLATATTGVGGGGEVPVVEGEQCRLAIGGLTRSVRPGLLLRFPLETRWGFPLGGLVGYDLMKRFRWTFDFAGMRVLLEPR